MLKLYKSLIRPELKYWHYTAFKRGVHAETRHWKAGGSAM